MSKRSLPTRIISRSLLFLVMGIFLYGAYYAGNYLYSLQELKEERSEISNPAVLKELRHEGLNSAKEVKFAVMGDIRNGDKTFKTELTEAKQQGADFVMILGDLVPSNRPENYYHFAEMLEKAPLPALVIPGNHDYGRHGSARYRETFGPTDYAFDFGGYHFITLDNARDRLTDGQLRWLEKQLQSPSHKIVFLHEPPATMKRWAWHGFTKGADRFVALMDKYKPERVFMSHIHAYDELDRKGVKYIISGGGGAELAEQMGKKAEFYHFILVDAEPKKLTTTVVRAAN
jgi:1,2-diacylglycerol 3-alpha-glucosyltransferase